MNWYVQSVMLSSLIFLLDILKIKDALINNPELFELFMTGSSEGSGSPVILIIIALIPIVNILIPLIVLIIFSSDELLEKFINFVKNEGDK